MFLFTKTVPVLGTSVSTYNTKHRTQSVSDNETDRGENRRNWYLWSSSGKKGLFKYQLCLQKKNPVSWCKTVKITTEDKTCQRLDGKNESFHAEYTQNNILEKKKQFHFRITK